jgi:hypothetical protein
MQVKDGSVFIQGFTPKVVSAYRFSQFLAWAKTEHLTAFPVIATDDFLTIALQPTRHHATGLPVSSRSFRTLGLA